MTTTIKTFLAGLLLFPGIANSLPPEFSASYFAETYGVVVAHANYKLEHVNNNVVFIQDSAPIGFAALFSDDELREVSHLSLHNNELLLDEYHFEHKGSDDNKDVHLKIKWDDSNSDQFSGIVSGTVSNKPVKYNTTTKIWDTLSFQIPIMMGSNVNNHDYTLIVKGKLKKYKFITHGNETLTVGDNTIDTIKMERKSDNNRKPLYLWVAPSLNNLPVKIEKWKKGEPHVTMTLNSASFPSDKNLEFKVEEDFDDL